MSYRLLDKSVVDSYLLLKFVLQHLHLLLHLVEFVEVAICCIHNVVAFNR